MTNPSSPSEESRFLELLEAIADENRDFNALKNNLPEELILLMNQFVQSSVFGTDDFTEADEKRLNELASQDPQSVRLLRSLIDAAEATENLGPVPDSIIQQQLEQILTIPKANPPAFTVISRQGFLEYGIKPSRGQVRSYDMARAPQEKTTQLRHTQRLKHLDLTVTIETGLNDALSIIIELSNIDPKYSSASIDVTLAGETTGTVSTIRIENNTVCFENLAPDRYSLEFAANQNNIDGFHLELRVDNDNGPL
ncbi:hypothetical protein [Gimesia sp.]|uniref:hypothetical protein n=1 Tax=Gimesia sp. TaxID=2024833 RepID=UPI003A93ED95